MSTDVREGHVLSVLPTLPANHFHCAVTSSPYLWLRDYGTTPQVWPPLDGSVLCSAHDWRVERTKTLSVKVPPGVDTGDRIRLSGEGEAGPEGGPPGDLYVQMSVRQHPIFERDGKDLYCEVPITFADAALGGDLDVPTLDGRVKLKIPPETQTGKLFRLRGKGVKPVRGGSVGDLLCRVVVETPVKLNKTQKALLEELRKSLSEGGNTQSPRQTSWFEGVKNFFDDMKL